MSDSNQDWILGRENMERLPRHWPTRLPGEPPDSGQASQSRDPFYTPSSEFCIVCGHTYGPKVTVPEPSKFAGSPICHPCLSQLIDKAMTGRRSLDEYYAG